MAQFESVQLSSTTEIVVTFQFEGFHHWPKAPSPHTYLSDTHRHMFHVKAWKEVFHGNREIEIIQFKRNMHRFAMEQWGYGQITTLSCEQMAEALCKKYELSRCEVLEDGENGAIFFNTVRMDVVHKVVNSNVSFQRTPFEPESKPVHFQHCAPVPEPIAPKRPPAGSIFIGNECEGPKHLRGRRTLFIPASRCTVKDIKQWSHIDTRNMAIYLGAGGDVVKDSTFTPFLQELIGKFPFEQLLIEVRGYADLSARIEHILVFVKGKTAIISHQFIDIQNEQATYYKTVQGDTIYWVDMYGGIHTTSVNDPEFSKDEVV